MKHFLQINNLSRQAILSVIDSAIAIKAEVAQGNRHNRLANKLLIMAFEAASTRTRQSFTAAMVQSGGAVSEMNFNSSQIANGETLEDTARALGCFGDALLIRTLDHQKIETFAQHSSIPVINGLSNVSHPCQVMADLMTFIEIHGDISGKKIAWIGDCNNVAYSWVEMAKLMTSQIFIACPEHYRKVDNGFESAVHVDTAGQAADNADLVMTDAWVSMGDTDRDKRLQAFVPYQVNTTLMACAKDDAVFMHCLPAHREEEVSSSVIDGAQSVVWQQAENRLHVQKALLLHLLDC